MATIESGGAYVLFNAKAGNCVDLSGTDGESVIGWDYHGGDNQKVRPAARVFRLVLTLGYYLVAL